MKSETLNLRSSAVCIICVTWQALVLRDEDVSGTYRRRRFNILKVIIVYRLKYTTEHTGRMGGHCLLTFVFITALSR
jgi:hypothetical protein